MERFIHFLLVCLVTALLPSPVYSQWYASAGASVAFARDSRVDRDPAPGVSMAVGYRWEIMRVEAEWAAPSIGPATIAGLSGAVYVEPFHFGSWTPYGVAGAGWAVISGRDAFTGHGSFTAIFFTGIGVEYAIGGQWSVAADLRHYISDDERFARSNGGLTNFRANVIGLRVRYQFGG